MQIYIHRDGQQSGPYSVEETRDHLASGQLLPGDLAWHEGVAEWMPISQMAVLAPAAPPSPDDSPLPAAPKAWIPPRRDGAPSAQRTVPRRVPQNIAAGDVMVESRKGSSSIAPTKAERPTRRSSSGFNDYNRKQRAIGARNMIVGVLICGVGTAITLFSYEAAARSGGGGFYIIAGGAIIFGGIRFMKGFIQFFQR